MITKEEVQHIAGLARIGVSEKEIEKFSVDLSTVLDWVKQLEEVEVKGVEPISHITGMENVTREDNVGEFSNKEAIVSLFPGRKDNYGKVKSIL